MKLYQLPPEIVTGIRNHGADFLTLITEIVSIPNRTISAAVISTFLDTTLMQLKATSLIPNLIASIKTGVRLRTGTDIQNFKSDVVDVLSALKNTPSKL